MQITNRFFAGNQPLQKTPLNKTPLHRKKHAYCVSEKQGSPHPKTLPPTRAKNIFPCNQCKKHWLPTRKPAVFFAGRWQRGFSVGNAGKPIQENQTTHAIQSILISAKPFFSENTHTYIYIYIYITTLFVIVQIFIDSVIQIIIKIITATTAATKNYIKIITNIQKITLSAWKRAFFKTFFFKQMC